MANSGATGEPGAEVLILTDEQGNYYILPQALVEKARIPSQANGQVEELLGDTSGFAMGVGQYSIAGTTRAPNTLVSLAFNEFMSPPPPPGGGGGAAYKGGYGGK